MHIHEQLEIFLITYNRAENLDKTLRQIFADSSPIRSCSITVLDNCSTDRTAETVQAYLTHANLKYIRNAYNVGLGGNLVKAMEMARKPYFWILCDDDDFDWTQWNEVEQALASGIYDIVMTTYSEGFRNETIPYLLNEMAFVPSAIYKTAHIDHTVMTNAYAMAHNLFPFHALSIKIINNKGKIFVPKGRVILQGKGQKSHAAKKLKAGVYKRLQTFSLLWGYIDAYSLIEDKKLRYECMDVLCLGKGFLSSMLVFMKWFPFTMQNLFDIFYYVSFRQKIQILLALGIHYFPVSFYKTEKDIRICLFWFLKTKIWSFK